MKAVLNKSKINNTIKMALFIATNVDAVKGSPVWNKMNELLNWLNQYDNNDTIIINNNPNINIKISEKEQAND